MTTMDKVKITRKDGITYERKVKSPSKLTRCLCIRIDDERFNKLKEYGNACTIIRDLIDNYLDDYIERKENGR